MRITFKPYRFWLPGTAILVSVLLMWLETVLNAGNVLNLLNEIINFPADQAFTSIWTGRHHLYGFQDLLSKTVFLSFVGLLWYAVGLELDFQLLRRAAASFFPLRECWLLFALGLHLIVAYYLFSMAYGALNDHSWKHWDAKMFILVSVLGVLLIGWLEAAAFRFWRGAFAPEEIRQNNFQ